MTSNSHASPEFWKLYYALPKEVQYELFAENPSHPSLRLKPAGAFWSVRISRSYRALAVRRGDQFFWFWIGPHDEYGKMLKR